MRLSSLRSVNVMTEIVLDWGFPVSASPWVQELINQGVRLIWNRSLRYGKLPTLLGLIV